jgi:hypothetical protein
MKVLDLHCGLGHTFEGWFASEADFLTQLENALVQCPLCGDAQVVKKPSAPRLNLLSRKDGPSRDADLQPELQSQPQPASPAPTSPEVTAAWMQMARRIVANTDDVGTEFAEVARKMHYGETEERAIRGKTTPDEARSLAEEGIDILPFLLPEALKGPLQ